jgi:ATP-binding cassette, subfamily B, bacterial
VIRLWRYALRLAPVRAVAIGLLAVVQGLLQIAAPVLLGQVVGRLPGLADAGLSRVLLVLLVALLLVLPLTNILGLLGDVLIESIDGLGERDVIVRTGQGPARRPDLATLDDRQLRSDLENVRGRQWEVQVGLQVALHNIVSMVVGVAGSCIALGSVLRWWAPLPLLLGMTIEALVIRRTVQRQMEAWGGQSEPAKHARYAYTLGMGLAATEVRVFGLSEFLRGRYWSRITEAWQPYWLQRRNGVLLDVSGGIVRALMSLVPVLVAYRMFRQGTLSLASFTTALALVVAVGAADTWALAMIERAASTLRWLERLSPRGPLRGLDSPLQVGETPTPRASAAGPATGPSIVFDDVTFAYPGADRPVLDRLTLDLPAGATVALVGVNGAGKSTLVKLLAGGYRPDRGRVLVDGVDLATLDDEALAAWQRRVAPITQDFVRFPLTAGDNVELGGGRLWAGRIEGGSWPPTSALDVVSERAGLTDLLDRLPAGWATPLDKTLPGGQDLSGGEWQRVALARALRAVDLGAGVLVLDEPAAALDVRSEARLVGSYLGLASTVTSLVISHRFSVVRPVPSICVLEEGRIVEQGSHAQLMGRAGRYSAMFTVQARRYLDEPGTTA